jgi:hypothetical protein
MDPSVYKTTLSWYVSHSETEQSRLQENKVKTEGQEKLIKLVKDKEDNIN